jgi:hypothetical protein
MRAFKSRSLTFLLGAVLALAGGAGVRADDTEIFVTQAGAGTDNQPNILFVLDTSGSMSTDVTTQVPYDPGTTYTGACPADRVYWRLGAGSPPSCGGWTPSADWFAASQMKCNAAQIALNASGYTPSSFRSRMWRNGSTSGTRIWDVMRNTEHDPALGTERHGFARPVDQLAGQPDQLDRHQPVPLLHEQLSQLACELPVRDADSPRDHAGRDDHPAGLAHRRERGPHALQQ